MSCYNRTKAASRKQELSDRRAEIAAIDNGTWPRDLDDEMRWGVGRVFHDLEEKALWARYCCGIAIAYLEDLQVCLERGTDPDLNGWEV